eukprot:2739203-Pleurochrysis_carterae.AAC.1
MGCWATDDLLTALLDARCACITTGLSRSGASESPRKSVRKTNLCASFSRTAESRSSRWEGNDMISRPFFGFPLMENPRVDARASEPRPRRAAMPFVYILMSRNFALGRSFSSMDTTKPCG